MRVANLVALICALMVHAVAGTGADAADKSLRMAAVTIPPHLANPFATAATPTITITSAIYDGLTRIGRDGSLKPWLAVSWRKIDSLTWRFELRRDVIFSNGAPFDAQTVAAVVAAFAGPGAPTENLRRELPKLTAARVIDPYSVEIVTAAPTPLFPRWASILFMHEPGALKQMGIEAFARAPVATGPFVAESWSPNRAVLKAAPGSWRRAKLDRIEVMAIPDITARVQAVVSGQADVAPGLGPDEVQAIVAAGGKGLSWTNGFVDGISMVTTRTLPFNDVRVRQALNMAVDRKALIDVLLQGATVPANQPAPRGALGYEPSLPQYPYDPAKARALLAAAGYPEGFAFVLETSGTGAGATAVYQQVAGDLRKVGVTMDIRVIPTPQYLKNLVVTGDYGDAITMPWASTPTLDMLAAVMPLHSCAAKHPWYCDPDIMPTITAATMEFDETKAAGLRRQIAARYHDQAPAIFLYEAVLFAGLSQRVVGFEDAYGFVAYDQIDIVK